MEEKRRLPSWMLGASTAKTASKPLNADARTSVVTKSTDSKAKGVTQNQKNLLVKCGEKRKKRGPVEKDVIEFGDPDQEVDVEKRTRRRVKVKAEESKPARKKNGKKDEIDSGNENLELSCDEEDDDLTMDDVLSIAKEFVKNEKSNTAQQKPVVALRESQSKSTYARSPMHEETNARHEHVEATSKIALTNFQTTEDPAQDMLDLFLGPLLKKPTAKEETRSINEIVIPRESKNQQHAAIVSDKPVTFTKKKSSLRDAVAMFLD